MSRVNSDPSSDDSVREVKPRIWFYYRDYLGIGADEELQLLRPLYGICVKRHADSGYPYAAQAHSRTHTPRSRTLKRRGGVLSTAEWCATKSEVREREGEGQKVGGTGGGEEDG